MEAFDRGGLNQDALEQFQAGHEGFMRARREGLRGRWMVKHPDNVSGHVDAVDFQAEIDARHAAGFSGYDFWTAELPEVEN